MAGGVRTLLWDLEPFAPGADPDQAPGASMREDPAPPRTFRRAAQNGIWIYLLGLFFMAFPLQDALTREATTGERLLWIAVLIPMTIAYPCSAWICDTALRTRCAYIVLFLGCMALTWPLLGWGMFNFSIYVAVMIAMLVPWRWSRFAIPIWSILGVAVGLITQEISVISIALTGLAVGIGSGLGIEMGRVSQKLHQTQRRVDLLAVGAERERIGRDLHDILGHSLTAISIKSGLAGKLSDRDPTAARAHIAEVEQIARQALGDVRATTSAMRTVTIANELASARSVLMAAGVEASVPTALPPLSEDRSRLFGYVVREAVTNVVRHAHATTCVIEVQTGRVTVTDDGVGLPRSETSGTGLTGLTGRLTDVGGSLTLERIPTGGTRLAANVAEAS